MRRSAVIGGMLAAMWAGFDYASRRSSARRRSPASAAVRRSAPAARHYAFSAARRRACSAACRCSACRRCFSSCARPCSVRGPWRCRGHSRPARNGSRWQGHRSSRRRAGGCERPTTGRGYRFRRLHGRWQSQDRRGLERIALQPRRPEAQGRTGNDARPDQDRTGVPRSDQGSSCRYPQLRVGAPRAAIPQPFILQPVWPIVTRRIIPLNA